MIDYKFLEDTYIQELKDYVDGTYGQHYATDKYQATDVIIDSGHGTGFCMGNIVKYAKRYGSKGTRDDHRKDLMKVLHYALIQLYIHDGQPMEDSEDNSLQLLTERRLNDVTPNEWDDVNKKYMEGKL